MNTSELIANMEATARKVTGRAVIVRIKKPHGASGRAQKDLSGRAVITLDPALLEERNIKQFAYVFPHELAHVKKHFDEMPRTDIDAPPSMTDEKKLSALIQLAADILPDVKRREEEAEAQAAQWLKVIQAHYEGYLLASKNPIMAVLQILYHRI